MTIRVRSKQIRGLIAQAEEQGWVAEHGGAHIMLRHPGGRSVSLSATAHDGGSVWKVYRSKMRRAGIELR